MANKPLFEKNIEEWQKDREILNDSVMSIAGLEIKRFFSLDGQCYREGALSKKNKELQGLVASLVLRCDDCILYHTIESFNAGVTQEEFQETLSIGLIVGGSIVIPHLRKAVARWQELQSK